MSTLKIVLLSVASSLVWALFVRELVGESLGKRAIWGGIFAAPVIGIVMGLTIGRMKPGSTLARAAVSLLGLYAAAILFGLAVGIADVATGVNVAPNARRIPSAVILQSMFGVVWGLTFMGYVVWLWPLAYVNFWLLWRERAPAASPREIVARLHRAKPYSAALLASPALDERVEWWAAGSRERLPWAGTWRGRSGIEEFFRVLSAEMDYERFDAEELIVDRNVVIAIVLAAGRSTRTGRGFESHIVREYTFRDGRIVRVRNFYDTAAYERCLNAEDLPERQSVT